MLEVPVTLREKNQLTLPERVAERLGAKVGDQLLIVMAEDEPTTARLVPLRRSYAGIATGLYGGSHDDVLGYIDTERASWEAGPGTASDGTRLLTFEESRRIHAGLSREQYEKEPKWRWPKCGICGRLIARMKEHEAMHAQGRIDPSGRRTDPEQVAPSRARVAKWKPARARRAKG